jgi:hypothetical protein
MNLGRSEEATTAKARGVPPSTDGSRTNASAKTTDRRYETPDS